MLELLGSFDRRALQRALVEEDARALDDADTSKEEVNGSKPDRSADVWQPQERTK
jgi:hypothetical protein